MATYTVKKGDNLVEIAKKYNVSTSAILDANPGVRSVGAGVSLRIPGPTLTRGRYRIPTPQPPTRPPVVPPPDTTGPGGRRDITPQPPTRPPYVPPPDRTGPGGRRDITPQPPVRPPYVPPPTAPPYTGPYTQPPRVPPYTGPYTQPPRVPPTYTGPYAPGYRPPARQGGGLIPGALRVAEQIAPFLPSTERVTGFLDRIFRRTTQPLDYRNVMQERFQPYTPGQAGQALTDWWNRPGITREQLQEAGLAEGYPRGSYAFGEETYTAAELNAINARQAALSTAPFEEIYQQRFGIPTEFGEEQGYILGDFRDVDLPLDADLQTDVNKQKARNKSQLLNLGIRPMFISEVERGYLGLTEEQMGNIGYVFDEESGQWILGGEMGEPQTYGAAAPYGGYGYGYPSYGYPQYIYPEYGGGGGGYTYPQSFVGREGGPYPQSFVGREQRGVAPQQVRNRAARFGAVTWRI